MNSASLVLQFVAVALLVLLNGFFVAAEFALVKTRETQIRALVQEGNRRAKVALQLVAKLDAVLSATQLGITLASLGLGWLGKTAFAAILAPLVRYLKVGTAEADWIGFGVGFTVITFLHIVAGELAPKSLAIQKSVPTALWVARPLHWFYRLFYPAIWLLNHAAFWLLRRCGLEPVNETQLAHSEEEIRLILAQNRPHTVRPAMAHNVAVNAFDLPNRFVRELMHPRQEIIALDTEATLDECLALVERTRYSRFPLCEAGDLDKTLGVVHSKDLASVKSGEKYGRDLQRLARKLIFIPEMARLDKLLCLFLERKAHVAFVVDEYGGTLGMVTLEDVLEALVGPIQDEFDEQAQLVRQIGPHSWHLDGALPIHTWAELLAEPIQRTHQVTTLNGWVLQRLGRFPRVGDEVQLPCWIVRVVSVAGTKAAQLTLERRLETGSQKAA